MMKDFFVYSDGRTGSTAICDELNNHSLISCWQEIFTYGLDSDAEELRARSLEEIDCHFSPGVIPFQVFRAKVDEPDALGHYIEYLHERASALEKPVIGFKALYNHAAYWDEECGFLERLSDAGFHVLHNLRIDLARKILSGQIAEARGLYNSQREDDTVVHEKVLIDCERAKSSMQHCLNRYDKYTKLLTQKKFSFVEVQYEKFLSSRSEFFGAIWPFVGVPCEVVSTSTWQKMTPDDLSEIIENFDEVTREIGLT